VDMPANVIEGEGDRIPVRLCAHRYARRVIPKRFKLLQTSSNPPKHLS
jgi:hypothetical protein